MRCLLPGLVAMGCAAAGTVVSPSNTADSGASVGPTRPPAGGPGRGEDSGSVPPPSVRLFVNELMPANGGAVELDGDSPDWLELYNPGSEAISLGGFGLTDTLDDPWKATLSDALVVPAEGFLLLYATGETTRGPEHLPFRLASDGEAVGLTFPDGTPADQVQFGAVPVNLSLARVVDGGLEWHMTERASPGGPNGED